MHNTCCFEWNNNLFIHFSNLFIHYAIFIRIHVRFNQSLLEYAIFIQIHVRFNQSLFKYAIFNRNYSKRGFYSKYHNVKQNVAKYKKNTKKRSKHN